MRSAIKDSQSNDATFVWKSEEKVIAATDRKRNMACGPPIAGLRTLLDR